MCVHFSLAWNQNWPGLDFPPHCTGRIGAWCLTLRNETVHEATAGGEATAQPRAAQEATSWRRGMATTATATATVNASPPTSMLPAAFCPVKRRVLPLSCSSLGFLGLGTR
jgi:hypothetical protein